MALLDELLAMPEKWEARPAQWASLIRGVLPTLREAMHGSARSDWARWHDLLARWRTEFIPFEAIAWRSARLEQWNAVWGQLICAQIAPPNAQPADLPEVLRRVDARAELPDPLACQAASLNPLAWPKFVRDQLDRLNWPAPLSSAWAWDVISASCASLFAVDDPRAVRRPVAHTESVTALLVDGGQGVPATLTLELLADEGHSVLYADPASMWHVLYRADLSQSVQHACACLKRLQLWPAGSTADVRWKLVRRDNRDLPSIEGGSAGAAFALGLAKLFVGPGRPDWLQALELERVAITATIGPDGRLGPIGGLWQKLAGVAQETDQTLMYRLLDAARHAASLGLVSTVVVAHDQPGVPEELLAQNAAPLRVLRAATLTEAGETLYDEHGPRFAVRQHELEQCSKMDILDGQKRAVPIEKHYMVLPLLRKVKELPRAKREAKEEHEATDTFADLRAADIRRWEEEALRSEPGALKPVELEQIFDDFLEAIKDMDLKEKPPNVPRLVILGPPGSGKTP